MAGWEAHARPLPGPLSPRGPQPTVSIVSRLMAALHGPLATSKGYGCLVRMPYGLADAEVATIEVTTPPLWSA
jgi:hypothetical protein